MKRILITVLLLSAVASAQWNWHLARKPQGAAGGGSSPSIEKTGYLENDTSGSAVNVTWTGGGTNTAGSTIYIFGSTLTNDVGLTAACSGCTLTLDYNAANVDYGGRWKVWSMNSAPAVSTVTLTPGGVGRVFGYIVSCTGCGTSTYDSAGLFNGVTALTTSGNWSVDKNSNPVITGTLSNAHSTVFRVSINGDATVSTFSESDGDSGFMHLPQYTGGIYYRYVASTTAVQMHGSWTSTVGARWVTLMVAYSAP